MGWLVDQAGDQKDQQQDEQTGEPVAQASAGRQRYPDLGRLLANEGGDGAGLLLAADHRTPQLGERGSISGRQLQEMDVLPAQGTASFQPAGDPVGAFTVGAVIGRAADDDGPGPTGLQGLGCPVGVQHPSAGDDAGHHRVQLSRFVGPGADVDPRWQLGLEQGQSAGRCRQRWQRAQHGVPLAGVDGNGRSLRLADPGQCAL